MRQQTADNGQQYSVFSVRYTDYRLSITCLLLLLLLASLTPTTANAQSVTTDDVNAVAKGLYCPVCESEPLDTCQTQACQDWRDEIRVQLSEGLTPDEIHEAFRTRYGDRVLAEPPRDGFTLLLWFGIPLAVVLGGIGFGRYLRTIRTQPAKTATTPPSNNKPTTPTKSHDDYVRRIEEELAQK